MRTGPGPDHRVPPRSRPVDPLVVLDHRRSAGARGTHHPRRAQVGVRGEPAPAVLSRPVVPHRLDLLTRLLVVDARTQPGHAQQVVARTSPAGWSARSPTGRRPTATPRSERPTRAGTRRGSVGPGGRARGFLRRTAPSRATRAPPRSASRVIGPTSPYVPSSSAPCCVAMSSSPSQDATHRQHGSVSPQPAPVGDARAGVPVDDPRASPIVAATQPGRPLRRTCP